MEWKLRWMQGRVIFYRIFPQQVVFPIAVCAMGVRPVILTNAAGGIT